MKIDYYMDIEEKSTSFAHTPGVLAKRLPFYIDTCGHFYANSDYYTEREGLDSYLLIYTIKGCGFIESKNEIFYLLPNQAILIYCGDYQRYKTQGEEIWEFRWIHFNGICAKEYYDILNGDELSLINIGEFNEFGSRLNELDNIITIENMPDIKICSLITQLLTDLINSKNSPANNSKFNQHKDEIANAIKFIQENYDEDMNIDDIAKTVNFSKYYFIRIFKNFTGLNPYEYLINYRINTSKKLLIETKLNINEIAVKCGFSESSNYIRSFKRIIGTTPLKFKNYWKE